MKTKKILFPFIAIIAMFMVSCGGNEDGGRISIQLTDAPFPTDLVAEANVTIEKIDIRSSNNGEEGEFSGPFTVLSEEEMSFNLLDLTNGITANLVDLEVEPGSYDLIRLYIKDASVKLSDETVFNLTIPSGAETGLKLFITPSIEVTEEISAELLLDFDVSKSFQIQGSLDGPSGINGVIFKPVIKVSNLSTSGRLVGTTTNIEDLAIEGVTVSLMTADTVYTTTFTGEDGGYSVLGVDAGTYNVVYELDGYTAITLENVEITAGNATTKDVQLQVAE